MPGAQPSTLLKSKGSNSRPLENSALDSPGCFMVNMQQKRTVPFSAAGGCARGACALRTGDLPHRLAQLLIPPAH